MKTVKILSTFDGYPSGAKEGSRRVTYREGDELELSNDFADLVIGKGLAREIAAEKPAQEAPAPRRTPKENAREAE